MKTTARFLVAVIGAALLVHPVLAQQPQKKDEKPATPNEVSVVPLRHALAQEVAQVVGQLFGDVQRGGTTMISVDTHTNSVLVLAQPGRVSEIKELIAKLDVKPTRVESAGLPLRVFALRHIQPDKPLEEAVRLAIGSGGRVDGKVAFDLARNQVIVSADEATLQVVEALITKLDVAIPQRPAADVQLRVVWLVKGSAANEFAAPPDDLKEVLPTLAKIGIDKPRLAAQTLVNVSPNVPFTAEGMVALNEPVRFSVNGHALERGDIPALSLSLKATGPNNNLYSSISTEISAPIGHLAVLGVTPTESLTSVFIVQVLRK